MIVEKSVTTDEGDILRCPKCDLDSLRFERANVWRHPEDGSPGTNIFIPAGGDSLPVVYGSAMTNHPWFKNAVAVGYKCQYCLTAADLIIKQHEGSLIMCWHFIEEETPTQYAQRVCEIPF